MPSPGFKLRTFHSYGYRIDTLDRSAMVPGLKLAVINESISFCVKNCLIKFIAWNLLMFSSQSILQTSFVLEFNFGHFEFYKHTHTHTHTHERLTNNLSKVAICVTYLFYLFQKREKCKKEGAKFLAKEVRSTGLSINPVIRSQTTGAD